MVDPLFEYQFRLILIGDSTVGKSSLLKYFTEGKFAQVSDPTVGVDFFARLVQVKDGTRIKLQLWDTAGQERFRSITKSYFRNSVGALLVYDITNRKSFENLPAWALEARRHIQPHEPVFAVVGCKVDLAKDDETVEASDEDQDGAMNQGNGSAKVRGTVNANYNPDFARGSRKMGEHEEGDDSRESIREKLWRASATSPFGVSPHDLGIADVEDDEDMGGRRGATQLHPSVKQVPKRVAFASPKGAPRREVTAQEARAWAEQNGIRNTIEASALTGANVEEAFRMVAQEVYDRVKAGEYELKDGWDGIKAGGFAQPQYSDIMSSLRSPSGAGLVEGEPARTGCC
ncbi:ras-related protein Rab-39B-like [Ischnura elegans]|uniref:ras-related protein Rab-39B-like n=1 Tax=Ischnura elegans TaxID=197161 RepID=UPI001ED89AAC|nr:ras-related protein Rab-39B-like [Ischnura elegans]